MTIVRTGIIEALRGLEQVVDPSAYDGAAPGSWRWTVRRRLADLRDALATERGTTDNGWIAARSLIALRERNALLARLGTLGPRVLEHSDAAALGDELRRLVRDVSRHVQRLNDLVYDDVELELGGSE